MIRRLIILLLIVGCGTEPEDNSIRGYVKDSAGNPLNNAAILLTYDSGMGGQGLERIQMPSSTFTYALAEDGIVLLWIESMCEDTVKILVNELQSVGSYSITWNADDVDINNNRIVDGMYKTHLNINDGELVHTQNILLIRFAYSHLHLEMIGGKLGYTEIINWETQQDTFYTQNYHAMTDESGYFSIPSDCLSFGVEYVGMDESGNPFGTYRVPFITKLWIFHEEHIAFETDWYDVDSNNGVFLNIDIPSP